MPRVMTLLSLVLFLAFAPAAVAQTADDAAIHDVITHQLEAIKKQDDNAAFAIASPTIQAMFGNAATFMSMVQRGYPQIFTSRSHRFLNIDTSEGTLQQRVLVEGETGSVIVRYEMIEVDGQWRINGCRIEKSVEA